jgi:flagellar hook assembly protein FlgD
MENKIYPLNVGESPLTPKKPDKKKPSFKDWIKERKLVVAGVSVICVLALGGTIWATGLGDKLLGVVFETPTCTEGQFFLQGNSYPPQGVCLNENPCPNFKKVYDSETYQCVEPPETGLEIPICPGGQNLVYGKCVDVEKDGAFGTTEIVQHEDGSSIGSIPIKSELTILEVNVPITEEYTLTNEEIIRVFLKNSKGEIIAFSKGLKEESFTNKLLIVPIIGDNYKFFLGKYKRFYDQEKYENNIVSPICEDKYWNINSGGVGCNLVLSKDITTLWESPSFTVYNKEPANLTVEVKGDGLELVSGDKYELKDKGTITFTANVTNQPKAKINLYDTNGDFIDGGMVVPKLDSNNEVVFPPIEFDLTDDYSAYLKATGENLKFKFLVIEPEKVEKTIEIYYPVETAYISSFQLSPNDTFDPTGKNLLYIAGNINKESTAKLEIFNTDDPSKVYQILEKESEPGKGFKFQWEGTDQTQKNVPKNSKVTIKVSAIVNDEVHDTVEKEINIADYATKDLGPIGQLGPIIVPDGLIGSEEKTKDKRQLDVTLDTTLTVTPKTTQEVNKEVNFEVKIADGGKPPFKYTINYGDTKTNETYETDVNSATDQSIHTFTHTYKTKGTYDIDVEVSDRSIPTKKGSASATGYVVTEAAQSTKKDTEGDRQEEKFTLVFDSVDPTSPGEVGKGITFALAVDGSDGPYSYEIEYGDDKDDKKTVGETGKTVTKKVEFKHVYEKAGTYDVSATVITGTGSRLQVAKASTTYTVKKAEVKEDVKTTVQAECNDGIDNDEDGNIDFPNDTGCANTEDVTENSEGDPDPDVVVPDVVVPDAPDPDPDVIPEPEGPPPGTSVNVYGDGASRAKFNPEIQSLKIYYKLEKDADVTIEIVDSKGDTVLTILDEFQESKSTSYETWWEGTKNNKATGQKVPDGSYTYKITATHPDYPEIKDIEEGPVSVDSEFFQGPGSGGDFEGFGTGTVVQPGAGIGTGPGTLVTGVSPAQSAATQTLQNTTTGTTAGTGPGVLVYFLFPVLGYAYRKIKY